jgi:hypothetical protein
MKDRDNSVVKKKDRDNSVVKKKDRDNSVVKKDRDNSHPVYINSSK